MARKLTTGAQSEKQFSGSYFNPLTGGYGSPIRYTQHLDMKSGASHWLPKGLTMTKIRNGDTEGYQRKRAAKNVPGWVWVKR